MLLRCGLLLYRRFSPDGAKGCSRGWSGADARRPDAKPVENFQPEGLGRNSPGQRPGLRGIHFPSLFVSLKGWDVTAQGQRPGAESKVSENPGRRRGHGDPPVAPFQGFKRKQHTRMNPPQLTLGVAQGCYIPAFQAERPCQPGQSALTAAILAIAGAGSPSRFLRPL